MRLNGSRFGLRIGQWWHLEYFPSPAESKSQFLCCLWIQAPTPFCEPGSCCFRRLTKFSARPKPNSGRTLILILKSDVSEEQISHVVQHVESMGFSAHLSRGTYRTIVGIIGDEDATRNAPLRAIPGFWM